MAYAVPLLPDVEYRPGRARPYRARVRWSDSHFCGRRSLSRSFATGDEAQECLDGLMAAALRGVDPAAAVQPLAAYGEANMALALRGLEPKTTDPYLAGWRLRVVPSLGHLPVRTVSNGAVDRSV